MRAWTARLGKGCAAGPSRWGIWLRQALAQAVAGRCGQGGGEGGRAVLLLGRATRILRLRRPLASCRRCQWSAGPGRGCPCRRGPGRLGGSTSREGGAAAVAATAVAAAAAAEEGVVGGGCHLACWETDVAQLATAARGLRVAAAGRASGRAAMAAVVRAQSGCGRRTGLWC
eukprot:scaffold19489_cov110-Isochrysis_galbana.AAC.3